MRTVRGGRLSSLRPGERELAAIQADERPDVAAVGRRWKGGGRRIGDAGGVDGGVKGAGPGLETRKIPN